MWCIGSWGFPSNCMLDECCSDHEDDSQKTVSHLTMKSTLNSGLKPQGTEINVAQHVEVSGHKQKPVEENWKQ